MEKLTQKELKRLMHYDADTGIFTWLVRNSNRMKIGDVAGNKAVRGNIDIRIKGKLYKAHRLAFLYMEGYMPEHLVDHKNGVKTDNRWKEIRHATSTCNMQNSKISSRNKSGYPGVYWKNDHNKWIGQITINGKARYLGFYDDPLEAALARFTAEHQCPAWECNYRSELSKAIKRTWPNFKFCE